LRPFFGIGRKKSTEFTGLGPCLPPPKSVAGKISPALIWIAAIEIPQMVPIQLLLIATGLLATDVLGVVMARMM
jgi:hypothetical protein